MKTEKGRVERVTDQLLKTRKILNKQCLRKYNRNLNDFEMELIRISMLDGMYFEQSETL